MQEHPDYEKGAPLKHLNLAIEEPKPGDKAVTAVKKSNISNPLNYGCQKYLQGLGADWV